MNTPSPTRNSIYFDDSDFTQFDETEDIFDKIRPLAGKDLPRKRNLPDYENFLSLPTIELELEASMYGGNYVFHELEEFTNLDKEKASINDNDNTESMTIEQFMQIPLLDTEFVMYDIQDPLTPNPPLTTDIVIAPNRQLEMKFEVDPVKRFRGRTASDFKPKKAQTRDGKPSTPRPPRYFTDGNTRQYLNLLIPKAFLSTPYTWLEICIVTSDINGYTYVNPNFKFQVHPTDPHAPNLNPIYMIIDNTTDLKPSVNDQYVQLKLKLVVVKLTNNELMESEQPLKIFSTPSNDYSQIPITTIYHKHDAFKNAYHLHDMRFAITLWKKKPSEKVYYRHNDTQYISSISQEDKTVKKTTIYCN